MNERKIVVADPTPVGLFGLAMVTIVASSAKLGWTSGVANIIPWALFLGAAAQLYACIQDAKKNNLFGATAFGGYAFFWFAIGFTWMTSNGVFGENLMNGDAHQLAFAFVGYLIFSVFMTIGSLTTNKVLTAIFVLIDCLFIGLAFSTFGIATEAMHNLAAYSEFAIAMLSFYGSGAVVINNQFGRTVLPLGKAFIQPQAASTLKKAA